ncbi:hypothetical protein CP583_20830 [Salmonella enterica]|nr:hypothetical protein [Salmonella enterica]EDX7761147.1 hypothetical protein [Salmonella enterica subsp. enterica serovar Thompson]EAM5857029.1 hypothetical protein [Salmonella enterica]EAO3634446.1 hypothetical protein [Salmonella enterica]EAS3181275.1 hypothetical protein [Salmonella enterica]
MKYIMLRTNGKLKRDIPIIFPDLLAHKDVADAIAGMELYSDLNGADVVSAGFCNVGVKCFGESESCNAVSREVDDVVINTYDYTHGLMFD